MSQTTSTRPILAAPMAGGPSTPALVASVGAAGGLGFLAGGLLTPEKLRAQIEELEASYTGDYGINLFVPDLTGELDEDGYRRYRARLAEAGYDVAETAESPERHDDWYPDKFELALASRARYVSFTFGHPSAADIARVHEADKQVVLYATSPAGVDAVLAAEADALGLQGPEAGGHSATVAGVDSADRPGLDELLAYAMSHDPQVPVIAGGGVAGPEDVTRLLDAGATWVQVGTQFLDAHEAGTNPTHRTALRDHRDRDTMVTTAFSGKPARTIRNRFAETFTPEAPAVYPAVHYLTGPLRRAAGAAGDTESINLWAGTGFAATRNAPAAEILAWLAGS